MHNKSILQFTGSRIRKLRLTKGYSQEEFAHMCQLDRTYISGIERGLRNVSLLNLTNIANALDLPLTELFYGYKPTHLSSEFSDNYLIRDRHPIECGFAVTVSQVQQAIVMSTQLLESLPYTLFSSIGLKSTGGMVGALFINYLAEQIEGAIPNPIEKGHPDIIPKGGQNATEQMLRQYPEGLEIKSTIGNVAKGSQLKSGDQRIDYLSGLTWQAHHREVGELLGLVWDFAGKEKSGKRRPIITGAFYTNMLQPDDWGVISGTTGRNTKVTGMRASGKKKMGSGWLTIFNSPEYLKRYQKALKFSIEG